MMPSLTTSSSSSSVCSPSSSCLLFPPSTLACVSACNLNQWAMDFDGNLSRTIASIRLAKKEGAKVRVGPELELCGYGCEDHFLEIDTITHCWESLKQILQHPDRLTYGMLVDIGMPVMYRSVIYNCRVFCLNGRVILIRPKMYLASSGNYREGRWFGRWSDPRDACYYPITTTPPPSYSHTNTNDTTTNSTTNTTTSTNDTTTDSTGTTSQSTKSSSCSLTQQHIPSKSSSAVMSSVVGSMITTAAPPAQQPFPTHPLIHPFHLPPWLTADDPLAPSVVPIGIAAIECINTTVASETCEELWTPSSPHVEMSLDGVEIFLNGSGSHHELRKLRARLDLIQSATYKCGGAYVYSNMRGCDGGRLYFDGNAMVAVNGKLVGQAGGFGMDDVEVVTRVVDLEAIRSYRASSAARSTQVKSTSFPRIYAPLSLQPDHVPCSSSPRVLISPPVVPVVPSEQEEIAYGPSCWLWDYLRRSGARGFFLPLSGGADSGAVAAIVGCMTQLVAVEIAKGNETVVKDVERLSGLSIDHAEFPRTCSSLSHMLLHTAYLGSANSSHATQGLAQQLSTEVGSYHLCVPIESVVQALINVFSTVTGGLLPQFGKSREEDLALQNLQARVRMVLSYLFASLLPWVRRTAQITRQALAGVSQPEVKTGGGGFLLVLATGNVDEGLRGYLTKYDCSSGDINPIGSISKLDLRRFLLWAADELHYPTLKQIAEAPPSAELRPADDSGSQQDDEADMGLTYHQLSVFGYLRKVARCGPVSMFRTLLSGSTHCATPAAADSIEGPSSDKSYFARLMEQQMAPLRPLLPELPTPYAIAAKVKHFFRSYGANRHKMSTITPAYHAEAYSPDDNRFDHRQILYPAEWSRQFSAIDNMVRES
eukprot:GHVS01035856.1.p1 GENE.GHVS01035856.1~~GHVS01035856.1.p1  ORF type:complete len:880 (+),score=158.92 GHVS01035856.1:53-2692(+)